MCIGLICNGICLILKPAFDNCFTFLTFGFSIQKHQIAKLNFILIDLIIIFSPFLFIKTKIFTFFQIFYGNLETLSNFSLIYKLSLVFIIFHLLLSLISLQKVESDQSIINEELWCFKILFLILLIYLIFRIPNSYVDSLIILFKIFSQYFIIHQIIVYIDISYKIGESLVEIYDKGSQNFKYCLFIFLILQYLFYFYIIIKEILQFHCKNAHILIIIQILLNLIPFVIILMGISKNSSLIICGNQIIFSSILFYFGLSSNTKCNYFINNDFHINRLKFWSLFIFSIIALINLSMENTKNEEKKNENITLKKSEIELEDLKKNELLNEVVKKENKIETNYAFFHLLVAFFFAYTPFIFSNGSFPFCKKLIEDSFVFNNFSYFIFVGYSFFSCLLFIWTLIAPKILKDRSFD